MVRELINNNPEPDSKTTGGKRNKYFGISSRVCQWKLLEYRTMTGYRLMAFKCESAWVLGQKQQVQRHRGKESFGRSVAEDPISQFGGKGSLIGVG